MKKLIEEAHNTAVEKGWWEEERSFGEQIALMHSELSEALEDYRERGFEGYYEGDKPCGVTSELVDTIIRIFDTAGKYGLPIEKVLEEKMAYNKTRSYKHGGKKI